MRDADAILWTLDRDPLLRSTIVAVAELDRDPDVELMVAKVTELCRRHHRFRSVVVPPSVPWGRPTWREVSGFEVATNLSRVRAPLPGTRRDVLDLAEAMAGRSFDPARPPWEMVLVDGLAGGGAALIIKVHHSVIDGIGGLQVIADVLDPERTGSAAPTGPSATDRVASGEEAGGTAGSRAPRRRRSHGCPTRLGGALRELGRLPGTVVGSVRRVATDPTAEAGRWLDTVTDSGALVAPSPAPLSPVMRGRGLDRYFATVDLDVIDLHAEARRAGLTLNDVFVSGLLRGLATYHHQHGRRAPRLRALMPVSTRRPDDPLETNRFVPVRLTLPADLETADDYLDEVPALLERWKHSTALPVSDLLTAALDRLPPPVVVRVFASMLKGVDFTATDVPGPPADVYFGGAKVVSLTAFAPTAGAALNAGLVTMSGRQTIGIAMDRAAIPDPSALTDCLRQGFDEIIESARRRGPQGPDPTG